MRYPILFVTLMLSSLPVAAQPSDRPPELKPVPDGAPGAGDAPAVTIRQSDQGRVVEYRANGKLFMIKVIPKVGKPYYLLDQTGGGQFARHDGAAPMTSPPMWVVKEF